MKHAWRRINLVASHARRVRTAEGPRRGFGDPAAEPRLVGVAVVSALLLLGTAGIAIFVRPSPGRGGRVGEQAVPSAP